jgi:hypothetical protein
LSVIGNIRNIDIRLRIHTDPKRVADPKRDPNSELVLDLKLFHGMANSRYRKQLHLLINPKIERPIMYLM